MIYAICVNLIFYIIESVSFYAFYLLISMCLIYVTYLIICNPAYYILKYVNEDSIIILHVLKC